MDAVTHPFHQQIQLIEPILKVRNLERCLTFYQGILGFRLSGRDSNRCELVADSAGPTLLILEQDLVSIDPSPEDSGLFHLAYLYPDRRSLAEVLQRLLHAKYPIQGASDHGVSEAIYLADPEGNGLELYVDRDPSQWPLEEGKLGMFTRRLDLDGLLKTLGSDAPATVYRMPKTTILGHVHLKVEALDQMDEFFKTVLGAQLRQQMRGASFYAFNDYHHHIAANVWESRKKGTHGAYGLQSFTLIVNQELFDQIFSAEYINSGETDMGSKLLYESLDFRLGSFDMILRCQDEAEA